MLNSGLIFFKFLFHLAVDYTLLFINVFKSFRYAVIKIFEVYQLLINAKKMMNLKNMQNKRLTQNKVYNLHNYPK